LNHIKIQVRRKKPVVGRKRSRSRSRSRSFCWKQNQVINGFLVEFEYTIEEVKQTRVVESC
jgi:hypothetical protein